MPQTRKRNNPSAKGKQQQVRKTACTKTPRPQKAWRERMLWGMFLFLLPTVIWASATIQDDNKPKVKKQVELEEEEIPDSLLHPRWKIQRTTPVTYDDLSKGSADLTTPENVAQTPEYDDTLDSYVIGSKMAGTWLTTPVVMSVPEYLKWTERQSRKDFFRSKNAEVFEQKGKEKFDFMDMHFDLGPAEKIFGPGGVRIKTQGSAELKFGATMKNIDNPSLPISKRKTTSINFDEKINVNVNGKVGDKVNMNLSYNTDATFEMDQQNLKLKYEGKEDEIIKLVEAGNVSFPGNSSLVSGASSLFGIRTDMQFGKLKLQTVVSQKKSNAQSVSTKGGVQFSPFEIDVADYEENRHFFLAKYFHDIYDDAMQQLPNLTTGINITRVEIWVTNKTGQTDNTRDIVALADLGEGAPANGMWGGKGAYSVPGNDANGQYAQMVSAYAAARDIDQTSTVLEFLNDDETGRTEYEKLEKARKLNSTEYTLNSALGYVSLKSTLQTDQVLAVAYEYTYGGVTYQVGEFASDITDINKALYVKALKNTTHNPQQANWPLMMKNVYYLATNVEKEKFRLDVKFQSDTAGVYLSYLPEPQVKEYTLLKVIGADRLDNNNRAHSNGSFDYVEGYTVSNGRVFLPKAEPFGRGLYNFLIDKSVDPAKAAKYAYTELYDSTKTVAKQIAEKDKFMLQGQFKGSSANEIYLGASQVPQGSVVVTAGGVTLVEGADYIVDYASGIVSIINQSIIDAGTPINVSLESNDEYGMQRKTMLGLNWEYDFSKDFQMSGTVRHLSEQSLTTKVAMGAEPVRNTLWGLNLNWKKESQWLTNALDKIPFLNVSQPSYIQFNAEFAHLIAGQAGGTQDNASYLDDFEDTKTSIQLGTPSSWVISSVPSMFPDESKDKTTLAGGYHRARLAWYNIDPLFTRRSSTLTPSHIKGDLEQLSNHYVREVYTREVYPNRDLDSYSGTVNTLPILNLAYYPAERGPYNFNPALTSQGLLQRPGDSWGGMMRKLDNPDFEASNIEYIEFWMLDPFIYTRRNGTATQYGGDLYFNLGELSEDILHDGKKFYESGMSIDGTERYAVTQWGKVPQQNMVTYAFATSAGSRAKQDVGLNGLTDDEERNFESYQTFLNSAKASVEPLIFDSIYADPANDNYRYFRGDMWDEMEAPILERYKYINNPQGNSPDSDTRSERYDTSYKITPDVEDINQDYTLNENEKYYEYKVSIREEDLQVGRNFIVDKRVANPGLRNGNTEEVTWYLFRIPLKTQDGQGRKRYGNISDFTNIRFMRMIMAGFEKPLVLRFASLDLVRGAWRVYEQTLNASAANTGTVNVSAVNIEENNDKSPVNYVLPPGISRVVDPSQPQLKEDNEQSMDIVVNDLSTGEAKAVYKNMTLDVRQYKRLQMFVHANALEENTTNLRDDQLALFIRLGSDYKSNYYEYEIPLKLTPPPTGTKYSTYSLADCKKVWPEENMLDIKLSLFTALKKERNIAKAEGRASYNVEYSAYDEDNPKNKITILGNPTLGEVKTMVIGVRNLSSGMKSGEVWVNEMRLLEPENSGGWAAQGNLNVQLSDLGSVNATGKYISEGFGGLEESVTSRSTDNYATYSFTTNLELGKFFPEKAKVQAPLYYSITRERTSPKYNPLDTDMRLDDALDAAGSKQERDSIESIAVMKNVTRNFSLSGVKLGIATKRHPMPYDPANFTFSYSHSHTHTDGETTVYENEDNWRGSIAYSWTPVYKPFEPFKKIKSKSKYYDILKLFAFNWLPQNIGFNTDMVRNYYEMQERDLEDLGSDNSIPATFSSQFLWNREFQLRWDLTKNLKFSFNSATHAEIEEPYVQVNKDLYPDQYQAWKDSIWTSIRHMGTPLDYQQNVTASYQLPLSLIPVFDWVKASATYNASYNWQRGSDLEDGTSLGNTIGMNRSLNINGDFKMEKLYDHVPFLKKTNERFKKTIKKNQPRKTPVKDTKSKADAEGKTDKTDKAKAALPKNSKAFERELSINADTAIVVTHGKKTKRLIVSARNAEGKLIDIKYKVVDDNKIKVFNRADTAVKIKVSVLAKEPLDNKKWYRTAQSVANFLMMVRNVSFSLRDQYSMSLPGFMPSVGDVFGQKKVADAFSPGLDFAFGLVGDSYLDKAVEKGWLLNDESVATPVTTNRTRTLQIKATLQPIRNLKIDLSADHSQTKGKSIQYMYQGNPTILSGSMTMTTVAVKSAFGGIGNANNGYQSSTFEKFCKSLDEYKAVLEARYADAVYPGGTEFAGKKFATTLVGSDGTTYEAGLDKYSADVMVPAFLKAYTGMDSKGIFPAISKLLPNWTVRYNGLSQLTWFQEMFKNVDINHAYKCIYAVGSYSSYNTFMEFMGDYGFITDNTQGIAIPRPSSMFNVSQVSINESFSPLLGINLTLQNDMTVKMEYRKTRVLSLSMTSVQLNETSSSDWVIGMGYKINDFNLFTRSNTRTVKGKKTSGDDDADKAKTTSKVENKRSFNHDLKLQFDFSLRNQAAIMRDIAAMSSTASSGNKALKLSFLANYSMSRLLTMSFYYDCQVNTPLLSSSSYPTTTHDFGLSMKFSLTR